MIFHFRPRAQYMSFPSVWRGLTEYQWKHSVYTINKSRMSLCLFVCLHVCLSVCLSVCLYVCMYVYMYVCTMVFWLKLIFAQFALITCDFSRRNHREISPAKEKFKCLIGYSFRRENLIWAVKFRFFNFCNR